MSSNHQIIPPRQRDIGETTVRRSLPFAKRRMIGPFIFWDHMGPMTIQPDAPLTVKAHPHIGLSTLTYLFEGEMLHRDSLGNELTIRPGEVNWMTAGKGIAHSERTRAPETMVLEGLQLWVALPTEWEMKAPAFQHVDTLPDVEFGGQPFRLIAGSINGQTSPVATYSDLVLLDGKFEDATVLTVPTIAGFELGLYVAGGAVVVDNETHNEGTMIAFAPDQEAHVQVRPGSRIQILGGRPFPEPRHIWWNFVASDPAMIEQAKQDWMEDRMGSVIHEDERLPLPER
ncbi:pirin family protein [Reinekea blandensis]|uniref:Putative pirin n=1 Tax=Reinekea blandensis MED297 TaxID=314283 RepID=A4B9F6_9GAMM|nr:pirin family protein [Reinekea blandensis]EAR11257.1 putative pirin [Reinekea sp. MED297] [Reinekea blandensis MED297]